MIFFLITIGCFGAVGVIPVIRFKSLQAEEFLWTSGQEWLYAFRLTWPAILAVVVYELLTKWHRRYRAASTALSNRFKITTSAGAALREIYEAHSRVDPSWQDLRPVRDRILGCVADTVRMALGVLPGEDIVASLVDFTDETHARMRVVARSPSGRPIGCEYASEHLVAWAAIRNGTVCVENDVRRRSPSRRVGQGDYRSVIAIPVVVDKRAFAALSIDSREPYEFCRSRDRLASELEPYVGALALTYPMGSVSYECDYIPSRHRP